MASLDYPPLAVPFLVSPLLTSQHQRTDAGQSSSPSHAPRECEAPVLSGPPPHPSSLAYLLQMGPGILVTETLSPVTNAYPAPVFLFLACLAHSAFSARSSSGIMAPESPSPILRGVVCLLLGTDWGSSFGWIQLLCAVTSCAWALAGLWSQDSWGWSSRLAL